MGRGDLTSEEWARLKPHLPKFGQRGGRWESHRRVINGILFRQRTGVPWRDLPARFGKWRPCTSGIGAGQRTVRGTGSSRPSWPMLTREAASTGRW
ncbi:transposase [Streptomyces sp. NPDC091273]